MVLVSKVSPSSVISGDLIDATDLQPSAFEVGLITICGCTIREQLGIGPCGRCI